MIEYKYKEQLVNNKGIDLIVVEDEIITKKGCSRKGRKCPLTLANT